MLSLIALIASLVSPISAFFGASLHGGFELGRTFASLSLGHLKFGHLQRESCAIGHSYAVFYAILVCTLRPRGRRNWKMTPSGVYSQRDCLHQRCTHQCLVRGEDGGVDVRSDRWLQFSMDRLTAWIRGRVARRTSALFWKPGCSRGSRSLCKMCLWRLYASVPLHSPNFVEKNSITSSI